MLPHALNSGDTPDLVFTCLRFASSRANWNYLMEDATILCRTRSHGAWTSIMWEKEPTSENSEATHGARILKDLELWLFLWPFWPVNIFWEPSHRLVHSSPQLLGSLTIYHILMPINLEFYWCFRLSVWPALVSSFLSGLIFPMYEEEL